MVLGGWAFGGSLGPEGGAVMNGIGALIKETQQSPSPFPPCEDTATRWSPINPEAHSHQTPNLLGP